MGAERCKLDARLTLGFFLTLLTEITIAHDVGWLLPLIATVSPLLLLLVELVIVGRCKAFLNVVVRRVRSHCNLAIAVGNYTDRIV